MYVIVCGSRTWADRDAILEQLRLLPPDTVVIHGDQRGADRLGGSAAEELGLRVMPVPADWEGYGPAAGPIRNGQMLKMLLKARHWGDEDFVSPWRSTRILGSGEGRRTW
jgi:hypothetical protein